MSDAIAYDEHPKMLRDAPLRFVVCLLLIPLFGLGLLALGAWYLGTRSVRLTIENDELQVERGLLSKAYTVLKVGRIRTVRVQQSFMQRMLDTGDIQVFTSGDAPEVSVRGLPRPLVIRDIVNEAAGAGEWEA